MNKRSTESGNYPSGRVKFEGSRFLASSDHLLPLFHVNEKAEAQLMCLTCITIIIFYFSAFFKRRLLPSWVSWAAALALPENCEKITPFMQANVQMPLDTLAWAVQPRLSLWIICPREQNARMSDIPHPHIVDSTPSPRLNFWGVPFPHLRGNSFTIMVETWKHLPPFFPNQISFLLLKTLRTRLQVCTGSNLHYT